MRAPFFIALGIYAGGRYADKKKSPALFLIGGYRRIDCKKYFLKNVEGEQTQVYN